MNWIVHKFGGTSVGNADRYRAVARILEDILRDAAQAASGLGVVVSAMKGVTDDLLSLVALARNRDTSYLERVSHIKKRHGEAICALLEGHESLRGPLLRRIDDDLRDILEVLRGVWLVRTASERIAELISGYGEVWSAQILAAFLKCQGLDARWLDARDVLVVESPELSSSSGAPAAVVVDFAESGKKLSAWLKENPARILVITGFVASTRDGIATTLKRNGSDYSASIFGALLEAREITIWTDVDGVLSADPALVPDAVVLDEMSYHEVTELAYFGAKVVHPATMEPAIRLQVPVFIRNTFNPAGKGTKIHAAAQSDRPVKGFTTVSAIALLNVEGTGMVGVPGVAERLFGALRNAGVSVVMISQASSEHSICFAIPEAQVEAARGAVETAFFAEIHKGLIQRVDVLADCGILAAVGDNMRSQPGVAGKLFEALGASGVSVRAIAQGSSERNISAVIGRADITKALRSAHAAFYLSNQTLSVGIIGTGLIGNAFLAQLQTQLTKLRDERKIDIRVRALANSKKMLLSHRTLDLANWKQALEDGGATLDLEAFAAHVTSGNLPHSVIIDATASDVVPACYGPWLERGINIVTPNKRANTGTVGQYRQLRSSLRKGQSHFLYSTNVGAGLPIIQTLRDLHQTGDVVRRIEGILSGTLSFLFNSFDGEKPFSHIVKEAKALGFTEPDPRDDLAGTDVARKLVILAREVGLALELSDVRVESLVPKALTGVDVETYLSRLAEMDADMEARRRQAQDKSGVLRYVGTIDVARKEARVEIRTVDRAHPFARIRGSDNIVEFQTARYDALPLLIQGPGAGPDVTAAGVFADLLRLAAYFGAPL